MGDSNADCCCCTPCADGGNCSLPHNHAGEHYSDKETMLDYLNPTRHVIAAKDAEIARLRAEVEQMARWLRDTERLCGEATTLAKKTEADLAAHKRALAAGLAALRGDWVQLGAETAAEVVEAAQAEAMKEKP